MLEEVLIGFQRSLARATRSSLETARADWQVGLGQRSLYVVDSIGVTLQAGVIAAVDAGGQVQALSLDLGQGAASGASTLEFRVQARPIEALAGEQLILADADPLGHSRPRHRMRFTLIGRDVGGVAPSRSARRSPGAEASVGPGAAAPAPTAAAAPTWVPLADCQLTVRVIGGDTGQTETFSVRTNRVGQVDLEIDAGSNRITGPGLDTTFSALDLRTRDDDFFVFAECKADQSHGALTGSLSSNVIQFWVTRESPPPPVARQSKGRP